MDRRTDTVSSSASFWEEICLPKKAVINNNKSPFQRFDSAQKEVAYSTNQEAEWRTRKLICKEGLQNKGLEHDYTVPTTTIQQVVRMVHFY